MEIEKPLEKDENNIILQTDMIKYEDAYLLNNSELIDTYSLIDKIANVLIEIMKETDKIQDFSTTVFHAKSVPSISIKDYLVRIGKSAHCSDECFILALIYIDRITEKKKKFIIKSLNIHR